MKERMLTVLVPIKDSDVVSVDELPEINSDNVNVIYKHQGVYKRLQKNTFGAYEYVEVTDREFPELGTPLEIFNFTYDATRMGPAPTITANGVMWEADKKGMSLENKWTNDCHVSFNGENFYLKQIPTSQKNNEDARYRYDLDFVSERVVLEQVYLYDVVQPFITERPISESSVFQFFGNLDELAKRINASLLKSGLATLVRKHVYHSDTQGGMPVSREVPFVTYSEWNNLGMFSSLNQTMMQSIYSELHGDYNSYLMRYIYVNDNGVYEMHGYRCVLGTDEKGEQISSEDKLVSFDNNYIHEALQQVKDVFGKQYYITRDTNGDTLIVIGDCEHDFADRNADDSDFVRDADNLPTTENPFEYGAENELLSIEKTNTTDKVVTRITGVGSSENIPWHYPNPTGDGWIRPVYKRNGEIIPIGIDYPQSEGESIAEYVRYEKYLKNRLGDVFRFGFEYNKLYGLSYQEEVGSFKSFLTGNSAQIVYQFEVKGNTKIKCSAVNKYDSDNTSVSYRLYRIEGEQYTDVTAEDNAFLLSGGIGELQTAKYLLVYSFTFVTRPPVVDSVTLYYYPSVKTSISPWRTWFLGALLSTIGSAFEMDFDMYSEIEVVWPELITTNPNLKFNYDYNLKKCGWFDNGTKINISDYVIGSGTHYCFFGGGGAKTLGVDDVVKVTVGNMYMCTNAPDFVFDDDIHIGYFGDEDDGAPYYISVFGDISKLNVVEIEGDISPADRYNLKMPKSSEVSINHEVSINDFVSKYWDFSLVTILCDGWYKNGRKQNLVDFGIINSETFTSGAHIADTIEFQRVKYVTPQPNLMPEVYIRTDGEKRFYNAIQYPLLRATADTAIGEVQSGLDVKNPIYKEDETLSAHYVFENEYMPNVPMEHIENFDDVKPTIKEQTITINGRIMRIDVVEEFGYDEFDSNDIWESNDGGNIQGEYKHPYFFAKLRPLGFNLFDMALQEDMVISMTTGHCGACSFKIGVDENTKKNPVQIWEYDVYEGADWNAKVLKYHSGELRRYADESNLYYDTDGTEDGYRPVSYMNTSVRNGFLVGSSSNIPSFTSNVYSAASIISGEVGSLKKNNITHSIGDVKTSGRFIASQQDTSENYVWVALMKDVDTYGVIMPSANPNYNDRNFDVYVRPKSIQDVHTENSTDAQDEDNADKFVILNIKMPQVYLRWAEHVLSRKLVEYMYDNNYQKFNFNVKFSRIFLAQNDDVNDRLNENSVMYVGYNGRTYRQYVSHYTYTMSHDAVLPEISIDMNEELSAVRSSKQQTNDKLTAFKEEMHGAVADMVAKVETRIGRNTIQKNSETSMVNGNIISRGASNSFFEINSRQIATSGVLSVNTMNLEAQKEKFGSFVSRVNQFNGNVAGRINQIRVTIEERVLPTVQGVQENEDASCEGSSHYYFTVSGDLLSSQHAKFWLSENGAEQTFIVSQYTCTPDQGMSNVSWTNFEP